MPLGETLSVYLTYKKLSGLENNFKLRDPRSRWFETKTNVKEPRPREVGVCKRPTAIGVARIFDWGEPKPQITCNDVIRNFRKSNFLWGKDIVE